MIETTTRFVGLWCAGLAAGIALAIMLVQRALGGGEPGFYTQLMQLLARSLTVPAPLLGLLAIAAMAVDCAQLGRRGEQGAALWLGAAALLLSLAAVALTKLGHFPLNEQMLGWDPAHPPAEWQRVQSRWALLHAWRTGCSVLSFALLVLGNLVRG